MTFVDLLQVFTGTFWYQSQVFNCILYLFAHFFDKINCFLDSFKSLDMENGTSFFLLKDASFSILFFSWYCFCVDSIQIQSHFFLFYTFLHCFGRRLFLLYNVFQGIVLFRRNLLVHFLIFCFRVFLICLCLIYMGFRLCVFLLIHMFRFLDCLVLAFQMLLYSILHLGHFLCIKASVGSVLLLGLVLLGMVLHLVVAFFLFFNHIFYIFFRLVLDSMFHLFFLLPILLRSITHLHSGSISFRHFAIFLFSNCLLKSVFIFFI